MWKSFSRWAIQICQNQGFNSSPLSGKNTITFCNIWAIFARKQGGVTSQRAKIEVWQNLFHQHSSFQLPIKKFCFQHFPVLRLYITKDISEKFNPDFQVWLLFLVPRLHFWKKWVKFLDAEFNAESISTNFKSQK